MTRPCCDTCAHYLPVEAHVRGECRRHAPRPALTALADETYDDGAFVVWPPVGPDEWCGEHDPGPEAAGPGEDDA